jgi:predicted transposase/invertase (TIGR01784 family)
MLAEKNPKVGKAVAKLVELNADERARLIADSREKMRRGDASRLRSAEKEGLERGREEGREEERLAIACKLLDSGMPVEDIAQFTGLSCEVVQALLH